MTSKSQQKENSRRPAVLIMVVTVVAALVVVLLKFSAPPAEQQDLQKAEETKVPVLSEEELAVQAEQAAIAHLDGLREELARQVQLLNREQEQMNLLRRRLRAGDQAMAGARASQEAALAAFDEAFDKHPAVTALRTEEQRLKKEMAALSRRYGELNKLIDQARRERFAQSRVLMQKALEQRASAVDQVVGGDPAVAMSQRLKELNDAQIAQLGALTEEWSNTFRETRLAQQALRETKTDDELAYLAEWEQMNERYRVIVDRQEQIPEEIRQLRVDLAASDPELRELQAAYLATVDGSRSTLNDDPRVQEFLARLGEIKQTTLSLRGQIDTAEQALYEMRGEEWPGPWYTRGSAPVVSVPVFDLQRFLPDPGASNAPAPPPEEQESDRDSRLSDDAAQNLAKTVIEG
jgi:hypothetical protein